MIRRYYLQRRHIQVSAARIDDTVRSGQFLLAVGSCHEYVMRGALVLVLLVGLNHELSLHFAQLSHSHRQIYVPEHSHRT